MRGVLFGLLLAGCGSTVAVQVDVAPEDLADTSCAACGMIGAEQAAPRGQLIYRDGTHAHACSLGDLRAIAQAPSAHGAVVAVYVEALPAGFDVDSASTAPLPWVAAEEAWFVFGAERPLVMGLPVLSFANETDAMSAATPYGTTLVRWDALLSTPFHDAPSASPL